MKLDHIAVYVKDLESARDFFIRYFGGYPEGVSYSILIMNLVVPLIDRATKPHIFGEVKKHA